MKKSELKQLIKEEIGKILNESQYNQLELTLLSELLRINKLNLGDKYISANNLSKKLEPNFEEIYDFGGGKDSPFGDEAIVIDAFSIPKDRNPNNQIHDLNQYINKFGGKSRKSNRTRKSKRRRNRKSKKRR